MATGDRVIRISPDVWDRLADESVSGEALAARLAMPHSSDRLLAALDREGRRHLLVPLAEVDEEYNDRRSRGIEIITRELSILGGSQARYLDLLCVDPAGYDVFDAIGGDLARALSAGIEEPSVAARRLVGKWRRFWMTPPALLLNRDEQIGLFAELWFLAYWLIPKIGVARATEAWRGPLRARHDVELPGCSVEVKGTTSVAARSHRIHGIEQLVPPEQGTLYLFSLALRDEGGALNTLPSIVQQVRDLASEDDDAIVIFETRLAQSGYVASAELDYEALRLRVVSERLYRVDDGFPRLLPGSFLGGIPSGVVDIEYTINLTGFDSCIVATTPEQFSPPSG